MKTFADGKEQFGEALGVGGSPAPLVRQSITFANATGTIPVFAVTGDVIVKLIAVGKTSLTSAGACDAELGVTGSVAAMIAATDVTDIDADQIWHDASPDSSIEAWSVSRDYFIAGGKDIIMTLSAQIDAGKLDFYLFWIGMSSDANVVAS